jgi:hypothetical protein
MWLLERNFESNILILIEKIIAMALQKFYQIENVSPQCTNNVPEQTNI